MATRTDVLRIQFETDGQGNLVAKLKESGAALDNVGNSGKRAGDGLRNFAGGVIAALGIERVTRGLIGSIVEFQNLNARLVTLEGSAQKASVQFAKLQEFAAVTPFQLSEVVDAYAVLKSRGLDPTIASMTALGNIAGASGKGIQQIAEATADAITGEFERLKEFGVNARAEGDKVALTFAGVTTTVRKNADEILGFLQGLGETAFAGGIERQADTLANSFSNLLDTLAMLSVEVGESGLTDALRGVIISLTEGIQSFQEGGGIDALIESLQQLLRVLTDVAAFAAGAYVTSFVAAGGATTALIAGQRALLAALAATRAFMTAALGPIGLLAAGVGLLSVALLELATAESAAERAARIHSEARETANRLAKEGTENSREATLAKLAEAEAELKLAEAALETAMARRPDLPGIAFNGRDTRIAQLRQDISDLKEALSDDAVKAVIGFIDELEQIEPAATGTSDALDKAKAAADKYIESLVEQIATLGLSREELIRWKAQQEAAGAATQEQRDQILALAEALILKTRAVKADTDATEEAKRSGTEFARLQTQQARTLSGPLDEVRVAYEEAIAVIDRFAASAAAAGQVTPALQAQLDAARADAATIFEIDSEEAERESAEAAQRQLDEYLGVWGAGIDEVGNIIADGLFNGFEDAGDQLLDLFKDILSDLAREAIQNQIIIPIKQSITGGAPGGSPGGFGATPIGNTGNTFGGLLGGAGLGAGIGGLVGGGGTGATIGGAAGGAGGSFFGPIGTFVGSIIGGVIGGLFGGGKPNIEVRSRRFSGVEGSATSQLGSIFVDTDKTGKDGDAQDLANGLRDLDNAIAGLLTGGEIDKAAAALANFGIKIKGKSLDPQEIFEARLQAVIQAVEPDFARFLGNIDDLDERLKAFAGIRAIEDALEKTALVVDALDPNPINQLRVQMRNLNEAIDETSKQLADAIAAQDPDEILAASAAAQQAVVRRFEAEIALAQQLEATLLNAEQAARTFGVVLLQRLSDVGAVPASAVGSALLGNITGAQARVGTAANPDQALAFLDEFIGSVDAWLQNARAGIIQVAEAQTQAINDQLSVLDAEAQAIRDQLALADSLRTALADARVQAESFAVEIAQRLIDVGAATGAELGAILLRNRDAAQARVGSAASPDEALDALDQFIGTTDAWLRNSRSIIDQTIAAQTAAANEALAALDRERADILAGARDTLRQRQQAERDALTEQLDLAREWLGVLDQARGAIDALRFGDSNPLDAPARLALLGQQVDSIRTARDAASGGERAALDRTLIDALNERLALAQQVFDRPSADFLAVFNETLSELGSIQSEADRGQTEIGRLQAALAATQQGTTDAITEQSALLAALSEADRVRIGQIAGEQGALQQSLLDIQSSAQDQLTAINAEAASFYAWAQTTGEALQQQRADDLAEQLANISADPARLDEIAAEQAALQQALLDIQTSAQEQLAAINSEAAVFYEWARTTGEALQQERIQQITDRLNVLTGGTPIEAFIAQRQAESADLLRSIDSQLRAFLDSIRTGGATAPGVPVPGQPAPGQPGPGLPGPTPVIQMAPGAIAVTVSGSQSPQQAAAAVSAQIQAQLPQLASQLLRELRVA